MTQNIKNEEVQKEMKQLEDALEREHDNSENICTVENCKICSNYQFKLK
jgi:hypothetical protein